MTANGHRRGPSNASPSEIAVNTTPRFRIDYRRVAQGNRVLVK